MPSDGTARHISSAPICARARHMVQLFIPGNIFHTARLIGNRQWFLGGSAEWPGVEPEDVEIGDAAALAKKFPAVAERIRTWLLPVR